MKRTTGFNRGGVQGTPCRPGAHRTAAALATAILFCGGWAAAPAWAAQITLSCGGVGTEFALCKEGAEAWAKKTNNTVRLLSAPSSSNDRLSTYQQILNARSPDVDVYTIDVIWPGIIGGHFVDLRPRTEAKELDAFFPAVLRANTVGEALVAMPWFMDAGLLYFRKDFLEKHKEPVPKTWKELTDVARRVQDKERAAGRKDLWGYVFQGKAYEGLTCNALEWIASSGGGTLISPDGKITIDNPRAREALALAASWVGSVSPQGVLTYAEEESRAAFQSGKAVFLRNWPYVWQAANSAESPVKGKVGVAPLPSGTQGQPVGTLGGWSLAVSKYSKNQDAAISLVQHLTSRDEQKRRALAASFNPTRMDLYQDKDFLKAQPFMAELFPIFKNAVPRPAQIVKADYNRLSEDLWNNVHETLSGKDKPEAAVQDFARVAERLKRRGRW